MTELSGGEIAGIVIGSLIGGIIVIGLILYLLRKWLRGPTKGSDVNVNLDNKVVVITGCNTGIGKITAHEISKKGARIIMLCRNTEKADEAATEIRKDTGNQVDVHKLDLSSLKSVRECAQILLDKEDKIDILINNAGIMTCPEWKTEDGFEMQIGTNHFGHFLLTELLIPLLRKSSATGFTPRVVIVSSLAHEQGSINWDDVHFQKTPGSYNTITAYGQSKLANVLHATELARRVEDFGIRVYSLHPGVISTELGRHLEERYGCVFKFFFSVMRFFIKTPFHGAQTTLYCALEPSLENESGKYYSDCARKTPSRNARNEQDQKRFWEMSEEIVGLNVPLN